MSALVEKWIKEFRWSRFCRCSIDRPTCGTRPTSGDHWGWVEISAQCIYSQLFYMFHLHLWSQGKRKKTLLCTFLFAIRIFIKISGSVLINYKIFFILFPLIINNKLGVFYIKRIAQNENIRHFLNRRFTNL